MTPEQFKREVRNLEAMYRRLDSGALTGRNSTSSDASREAKYRRLRDALLAELWDEASPLFAMLDADEKLAERWNRLERRSVGAVC